VTLSATELALYDTDSAWSDVAALSGNGPDHPPAVGSGIGDGRRRRDGHDEAGGRGVGDAVTRPDT